MDNGYAATLDRDRFRTNERWCGSLIAICAQNNPYSRERNGKRSYGKLVSFETASLAWSDRPNRREVRSACGTQVLRELRCR